MILTWLDEYNIFGWMRQRSSTGKMNTISELRFGLELWEAGIEKMMRSVVGRIEVK